MNRHDVMITLAVHSSLNQVERMQYVCQLKVIL
jgi:hypothetical protein